MRPHFLPLLFYLHKQCFISLNTHTFNYVAVFLFMYLVTELLLLLYLALKNPNAPHLSTGSLNLAPNESKNPYIFALIGVYPTHIMELLFVYLTRDRITLFIYLLISSMYLLFTYSLHQWAFYLHLIN